MDTNPIYELRSRLRAASITGTGILSEDFRLKRAAENMKPLEASSPIFAKIGQLMNELFEPDCPNPAGTLLDVLTLADAVITTLGNVEVNGEIEPVEIDKNEKHTIINAPYSVLKGLLEALTTSGSGHYNYVVDVRETNPELFSDYRVKHAMVQALGASYVELADMVTEWLMEEDEAILPMLMRDFDPKGKKEMVRRVNVIDAVAKEKANDFYVKMLETAEKEVRLSLIYALRHNPDNVDMLLDMINAEKGNSKKAAISVLATMDDERAEAFFVKMTDKKPIEALEYIQPVSSGWSSKLLAGQLGKTLAGLLMLSPEEVKEMKSKNSKDTDAKGKDIITQFNYCITALIGKGGEEICECYRKMLAGKEKLDALGPVGLMRYTDYYFKDLPNRYYQLYQKPFEERIGVILYMTLMLNSEECLKSLALELYESNKSACFLAAALTVKLLNGEDCTEWLDGQITDNKLPGKKQDKEKLKAAEEALSCVRWNEKRNGYVFHVLGNDKYEVPVDINDSRKMIEWMKLHASKEMDAVIYKWLTFEDEEECRQMGEWFYQRALITAENKEYLKYMKRCGWTDCRGLGVKYFKNSSKKDLREWDIYTYVSYMPEQAMAEEAQAIYDAIKSGEIKADKVRLDSLERWIAEWSGR